MRILKILATIGTMAGCILLAFIVMIVILYVFYFFDGLQQKHLWAKKIAKVFEVIGNVILIAFGMLALFGMFMSTYKWLFGL
jgi:hypothetical protein